MKFGLCYIPDYHPEQAGSYTDFYDGMIDEVRLAEELGFEGAWFAEHRVPNFAFGSPAMFIAAAAREIDAAQCRFVRCAEARPLERPPGQTDDQRGRGADAHDAQDEGHDQSQDTRVL